MVVPAGPPAIILRTPHNDHFEGTSCTLPYATGLSNTTSLNRYQALLSSSSWTVGPADADALLEDGPMFMGSSPNEQLAKVLLAS